MPLWAGHHGWQQEFFFWLQAIGQDKLPSWERNISKHDIIQHKQITTEKCFFIYHKLGWDME